MKELIKHIVEKNYIGADGLMESILPFILEQKLFEMKKAVAAKMEEQRTAAEKVRVGIMEDDINEETEEQLDEARINLIKARVRGGKIQRRKRVSNVPGMTLRGGTLKRMSAAERRRRKLGARKGKMKRKAKMSRTLMKRKRSLQKRKSLGL